MSKKQCFVIVSDNGESWALNGDEENGEEENNALPQMIQQGWTPQSVTPGSGSKDDTSYWMVWLTK